MADRHTLSLNDNGTITTFCGGKYTEGKTLAGSIGTTTCRKCLKDLSAASDKKASREAKVRLAMLDEVSLWP